MSRYSGFLGLQRGHLHVYYPGGLEGYLGVIGGSWLMVLAVPQLFCAAHGASTTSSQLVHSFRNCDLSSVSTDEFCNRYEEANWWLYPMEDTAQCRQYLQTLGPDVGINIL